MKKNKHKFLEWCSKEFNVLKLPHAVWQSFRSIFPHLSGGTMATSQTCCHLPGELLNSAAECADRARIAINPTGSCRSKKFASLCHEHISQF
jgi:hypothetical protein